ncbi:hypothetical protein G6F56_010459 [Rhizopus delemar]|nr:hypothetical protein G6F56_010459 [Rhizopus delemar]
MIDLSRDIFEQIANYLEIEDLLELSLVSRQFYYLTHDEYIWKKKCLDEFHMSLNTTSTCWKSFYITLRNPSVYEWILDKNMLETKESQPVEVRSLVEKRVMNITANKDLIYGLERSGRPWIWQHHSNTQGELVDIPENLSQIKFSSIACRGSFSIGLTTKGTLWRWCDYKHIQKVNRMDNSKVIQVTCNGCYSSVLTDQGAVWFVSVTSDDGDTEAFFGVNLEEDRIIQLVGLYNHTLALTQSGRILLMNTRDPRSFALSPRKNMRELKRFGSSFNRSIWGAFEDFFVISDQGHVLSGNIQSTKDTIPSKISFLENKSVHKIVAGPFHYAALTTKGELFVGSLLTDRYIECFKEKYVLSISFADVRIAALVINRT